ncbi:Fumarylacetoacetase (fragment) [Luteimonas sp. 9C]
MAGADRPFAAGCRRLARQLRAVQVRPAPLQRHRLDQLRPSRPEHLHRAHFAERHTRHGEHGFRDLPAALAGGAGHVPPTVVPPQRGQRVHGAGTRPVRRQGRRVLARRVLAAQLHERARAGRGDVREGQRGRSVEAGRHQRHDGVHVRNACGDPADATGTRRRAPPGRLPGVLGGSAAQLHAAAHLTGGDGHTVRARTASHILFTRAR